MKEEKTMITNELTQDKAKICFEVDGRVINSLSELAILYDLNKSTVRNRWNRGVHDLTKLTAKPKTRNFTARKILYHGKRYASIKDFEDDNHLNCSTVRSRWERGVRNAYDLAKPVRHRNAE